MLWALTRQRIKQTSIQQTLHKHQKYIGAQSTLWLSKNQARSHYGVRCCGRGISIDVESCEERTIFSLAEYSLNERRNLLRMKPPPHTNMGENKWLLHKNLNSGSLDSVAWTAATLDQYFQGSLFATGEAVDGPQMLLVDAGVAIPSSPSRTMFLFNAQETSNPFLIDDTLTHTHFLTRTPLPPIMANALSTLWLQFRYTSMQWLPSDDVGSMDGVSVLPGQEPHMVFDLEPIDLVHFYQIGDEQQKRILHSAPRWALMRSIRQTLILSRGRWLTWRQLNLDRDVKPKRGGTARLNGVPEGQSAPQHNFWLHCDGEFAYSGEPERRHIVHRRLFYNSSQLLT